MKTTYNPSMYFLISAIVLVAAFVASAFLCLRYVGSTVSPTGEFLVFDSLTRDKKADTFVFVLQDEDGKTLNLSKTSNGYTLTYNGQRLVVDTNTNPITYNFTDGTKKSGLTPPTLDSSSEDGAGDILSDYWWLSRTQRKDILLYDTILEKYESTKGLSSVIFAEGAICICLLLVGLSWFFFPDSPIKNQVFETEQKRANAQSGIRMFGLLLVGCSFLALFITAFVIL